MNIKELVAEAYEKFLIPALYAQWTHHIVEAANVRKGQRVLDVACGTGILARAIAERFGAGISVSGVDANPGMLALAKQTAPEVDWREADAEG